jgi:hypothetical protein
MIAPKPKKETQVASFIARARAGTSARNGRARNNVRVITGFDAEFLARLDRAARKMGLNRSAFIVSAVAERLRELEKTFNVE